MDAVGVGGIGLALDETETRLCDARSGHFDSRGCTFGPPWSPWTTRWTTVAKPSKRSVPRVKEKLRPIPRRGNPLPWELVR